MHLKIVLPTPAPDGTEWLEIENDPPGSAHWFLYNCTAAGCYDLWFGSAEEAMQAAEEEYGVRKNDWLPADQQ